MWVASRQRVAAGSPRRHWTPPNPVRPWLPSATTLCGLSQLKEEWWAIDGDVITLPVCQHCMVKLKEGHGGRDQDGGLPDPGSAPAH